MERTTYRLKQFICDDESTDADCLVAELHRLGVRYLSGGKTTPQRPLEPHTLLARLAASADARLRLALIPLLLAYPDFTLHLPAALLDLPAADQVALRCYATAAVLLQTQHALQLHALFGPQPCLHDWFSAELDIPAYLPCDEQLAVLAACHRRLSGRSLNWAGTYRHGAESFLHSMERQRQWATTSIKS